MGAQKAADEPRETLGHELSTDISSVWSKVLCALPCMSSPQTPTLPADLQNPLWMWFEFEIPTMSRPYHVAEGMCGFPEERTLMCVAILSWDGYVAPRFSPLLSML